MAKTLCVVGLLLLECNVFSWSNPSARQSVDLDLSVGDFSAIAKQASQQDDGALAPKILENAKSWRAGDPLPSQLSRFRKSESDIPGPMDSRSLISEVSNLPLLAALVVDPGADPECREDALSQGLRIGGPSRFFDLLRPLVSGATAKNIQPWVHELSDRMSRPHVVVDALSISDEDMSRDEALAVLARIANDLRRGMPFPKVYEQYSEEFSYPPDSKKNGDGTKIGLRGPLVLFPDPALGRGRMVKLPLDGHQYEAVEWQGDPLPQRLWGLAYFDPAHLSTLLKTNVGDVISLRSEQDHEYVLYYVQEIYERDAVNRTQ